RCFLIRPRREGTHRYSAIVGRPRLALIVTSKVTSTTKASPSRGPKLLDANGGSRAVGRRPRTTHSKMRTAGVEPAPLTGQDPKSCASASSATFANVEA